MPRIALLTPKLTWGDAVSTDLIHMSRTLRAAGQETGVFAADWETPARGDRAREEFDPRAIGEIRSHRRLPAFLAAETDVLIYHYAVAWVDALSFFRTLKCRKIIKYHNVTPPEFFEPYHPGIAGACREGRRGFQDFLKAGADLYLAASEYNARDLEAMGVPSEKIVVQEPFHNAERLELIDADLDVLGRYAQNYPRKRVNLLTVGRVVPNKGHAALLRGFTLYRRLYDGDARLFIVGRIDPALKNYVDELRDIIAREGLGASVTFTGGVSEAALKSYYLAADALVILSEHEGFCVPLLEAMALKVPIIALAAAALPDTAQDAALLLKNSEPPLVAAALHRLLSRPEEATALADAGRRRFLQEFASEKLDARFHAALEPFLI